MGFYTYKGRSPQIGDHSYIAPSADILGEVEIGTHSSVWFGAVVRGDVAPIYIGNNTNVQDLSMLHVTGGIPLKIGSNVTVAHRVMLHSCVIEDNCLIGMNATILDNAVIGKNSLVAAGSVVPPNKVYPEGSFIIGSPAVVKRSLTSEEIEKYSNHYKIYLKTKDDYINEVECIS
jgi:carbonic anhydrase/acetyltransferase-like protein (isoleucine patch superfamily)